ncbi:hypothetical protein BKA69DRAFT_1102931 [Paraphysoderma sedebokerense]|nr:hypothetical protein BKA69DRAFT_1102931 [Paraphysoderma sedebokerense]
MAKELERAGCELRQWNLDDRASIERAMQGMDHVVFIPNENEMFKKQSMNTIEAMKSAQIKHMIMWSLLALEHAEGENFKFLTEMREVEEMVKRSGIHNVCVCRIGFGQQMLFFFSRMIQDRGILPMPTARGRFAPVNLRDCGLATANILSGRMGSMEQHRHQIYNFTGMELMTAMKMVEHANRVLQAEIEFKDVNFDEFRKILAETGELNETNIECAVETCMLMRDNKWSIKTDDLKKMMEGREPTSIETFFKNNADSFRPGGGRIRRLSLRDQITRA